MLRLPFFILISGLSVITYGQQIKKYQLADLERRINNPDTVYIINFWAIWCGPCVEELPEFEKFFAATKNQKVKLLMVSLDFKDSYPKKISTFIKKRNYQFEVVWLNETNADYFVNRIEKKWSGSIPATLFIGREKNKRKFIERKITFDELMNQYDNLK